MQRLNSIIAITAIIFFTANTATAQQGNHSRSKKWISENGYWVIEGNINSPKTNIFYCYNNNDSLIYTEKIVGARINLRKKTTLKKLRALLDNSLLVNDTANIAKEEGALVETILKKGRK